MSRAAAALLVLAAGCSPAPVPPLPVSPEPSPPIAAVVASPRLVASAEPDAATLKVRAMLARVANMRGLPVLHDVASRVLDRAGLLEHIRAHVEKEIPLDVVQNEGELLAALELVPPGYDFVEGTYKLLQGRIAGFYEPADHTMYLLDDLSDDEATETLAHELVHALQDQSFHLGSLIEYAPGDGDRVTAVHALAEGDAMSAMFDVVAGSAFSISATTLRRLLILSNAFSETSATTPHVLQESLIAPYVDGFGFVQRERERGGWRAVDADWRAPPASTEQLLHPEKLASREPPIRVAVPLFASLGAGYRAVTDDVLGEQGVKLMLAEWARDDDATKGAAGWGGDRYVVARRDDPGAPDRRKIAVAWHAVMDTDPDGAELAEILRRRFGAACRQRPELGPIAWQRKGRDVVLVAGPYERDGAGGIKAAGTCADARRWIAELRSGA